MKMKLKPVLWRTGLIVLDFLEIYLPLLSFSVMFLAFVIQIFFRYFLNNPLTWPQEVTIVGFIWTALLGACFAKRLGVHVVFSVLYDRASPHMQRFMRISGNVLIVLAFIILWKPAYEYVRFMDFQRTAVLRIPFNVVYFPFVVFSTLIPLHTLHDLYRDIRSSVKGEP